MNFCCKVCFAFIKTEFGREMGDFKQCSIILGIKAKSVHYPLRNFFLVKNS